jgi:hypothetical protein
MMRVDLSVKFPRPGAEMSAHVGSGVSKQVKNALSANNGGLDGIHSLVPGQIGLGRVGQFQGFFHDLDKLSWRHSGYGYQLDGQKMILRRLEAQGRHYSLSGSYLFEISENPIEGFEPHMIG